MASTNTNLNWKSLYASNFFDWYRVNHNGRLQFHRHLGIVETMFDLDGNLFEGRSDLHMKHTIEIKTQFTDDQLRRRLVLVWSLIRHLHPLMACKALYAEDFLPGSSGRRWIDKHFVYERPTSRDEAINTAMQHIMFVQDQYPNADVEDFYLHLTNTSRIVDDGTAMSRLYILPRQRTKSDSQTLTIMIVAGHEIADGLTTFRWTLSFSDLLNTKNDDLLSRIDALCHGTQDLTMLLPPAQEVLYPVHATNRARDRWNWAITYALRHVRHPPPAAFQNPLRRRKLLTSAERMPDRYARVLNYARAPVLNGYSVAADLSRRATQNVAKLCRQAGISIGSGAFTLVAMIMMRFEEFRNPDVPYWERLPFVGSFPLNPRPFLSGTPTTGKEDSLMLAFSDGVSLPFIPSHLDFAQAFRVLGRLTHRQLRQYQKRKRTPTEEVSLGSRDPKQLLPSLYLRTLDIVETRAKPDQRVGIGPSNVYPPKQSPTLATCGISSVGDRSSTVGPWRSDPVAERNDLVANLISSVALVRPRDGEFLVGAIGTKESLQFRVSYDGCAIDPQMAEAWGDAMVTALEFDMDTSTSTIVPSSSILRKSSKL